MSNTKERMEKNGFALGTVIVYITIVSWDKFEIKVPFCYVLII